VQLRGTFSTKNNAMSTHFLHDRRKNNLITVYILTFNKKYFCCKINTQHSKCKLQNSFSKKFGQGIKRNIESYQNKLLFYLKLIVHIMEISIESIKIFFMKDDLGFKNKTVVRVSQCPAYS
jgi:hypothetical protein